MSTALAIEWKLKQLGKFEGAKINTYENVLTNWDVKDFARPDDSTIEIWKAEYQTYLANEKIARKNRKKAVLSKLGLTKQDALSLLEFIQDGNDD